ADVLRATETDGPKATAAALAAAVLVVLLLVGLNRHSLVTLACCVSGTLLMLATTWLLGLKVNFLDFVALPITIGIGIDYSVNIAARERRDGPGTARRALATVGGAVAMCSFTTIVGYGSLLLSANRGIRSFGTAAIVGEVTCLVAALALAPALLGLLRPPGKRPLAAPVAPVAEPVPARDWRRDAA
ncbi:MAG TPA: MMPL family transporter, partial [Haliangiales bacterium]|nr:MMPL family transporter [Haliangiales bacterium]